MGLSVRQKRHRRWILAALGSVLVGIASYWIFYPAVPRFDTPKWGKYGELLLREATDGSDDFFLLRINHAESTLRRYGDDPAEYETKPKIVYRYIAEENDLVEVPLGVWDAQTSEVKMQFDQASALVGKITVDRDTGTLLLGNRQLNTAARTVLGVAVREDSGLVAVLTASGYRKSWVPFMGAGTVYGSYYHEVLRQSDGKRICRPRVLRGAPREATLTSVWTPNGKYVVYSDLFFNSLWIASMQGCDDGGEK